MDNKYAYIPDLNLDVEQLKQEIKKHIATPIIGLPTHQRLVKDCSYLQSISERYPFFNPMYGILITRYNYVTPIHIDSNRTCCLNIPILNTENSYTVFYEPTEELKTTFIKERVYHKVDSAVTEVFRFTLLKPTIINNKIPHDVKLDQVNKKTRIILSWAIDASTFEDAVQLIKNNNLT